MNRRALVLAAILALGGASVQAQSVSSDAAFGRFIGNVTGANKTTVGFSSTGTTIITDGVPSSGAPDGGSGFKVQSSGTIRNPAGNPVTVSAAGRVTNQQAAKAVGRFLFRVSGPLFATVTVGIAIKALLNDLGYGTKTNPDGTVGITKTDPNSGWCTTAPCYEYRATAAAGYDGYYKTRDAACNRYMEYFVANNPGRLTRWANPKFATTGGSFNQGYCNLEFSANGGASWLYGGADISARTRSPDVGAAPSVDAALQEVEDAIAAKSGWPTSSSIAKAAAEAKEGLQAMPKDADPVKAAEDAAPLNVVSPLASGPATSPGRTTRQVSNNPDGSQRQEDVACVYKHTYNGADVTTTEECTTTVVNDGTTGKTTTSTKTDSTPMPTGTGTVPTATPTQTPASAPSQQCGLAGQPACAVKVDETGTPTTAPQLKLDEAAIEAQHKTTRDETVKPTTAFSNWSDLFVTPPVVECKALTMPESVGSVQVNPCPVVDGAREVMAFLWALAAFWACVGFVREAV